jgi:hypothetical protein
MTLSYCGPELIIRETIAAANPKRRLQGTCNIKNNA